MHARVHLDLGKVEGQFWVDVDRSPSRFAGSRFNHQPDSTLCRVDDAIELTDAQWSRCRPHDSSSAKLSGTVSMLGAIGRSSPQAVSRISNLQAWPDDVAPSFDTVPYNFALCRDTTSDGRMDRTPATRSLSLGDGAALSFARSRSHFWTGVCAAAEGDGHQASIVHTESTKAACLDGTLDRHHSPRVRRSCHRVWPETQVRVLDCPVTFVTST